MEKHKETSTVKICDSACKANSSLGGDNPYTQQGEKDGSSGYVGWTNGKDSKVVSGKNLCPKGPPALIDATNCACGPALRLQPRLAVPSDGLIAI